MIWLGLLAIVGLPVLAFTSFVGKAGTRTAGHGLTVGGTLLTCWAWLPLALALLAGLWQGFAPPAWTRFGLLLLPLALMGVALVLGAVGARWIGGPAAGALQQRGGVERTAHVLGALALLSWPAMPVFLAIVLQPTAPGGGYALMLLWLLSAMIGLTGGVAMALATKADYPDAIRLVALTTAFVIWHGYPAAAFVQRQGVQHRHQHGHGRTLWRTWYWREQHALATQSCDDSAWQSGLVGNTAVHNTRLQRYWSKLEISAPLHKQKRGGKWWFAPASAPFCVFCCASEFVKRVCHLCAMLAWRSQEKTRPSFQLYVDGTAACGTCAQADRELLQAIVRIQPVSTIRSISAVTLICAIVRQAADAWPAGRVHARQWPYRLSNGVFAPWVDS